MKTLMISSENSRFEDPTNEAISSVAFAVVWNNSNFGSIGRIISPFKWSLTGNSGMREYLLRDSMGEIRSIEWGKYSQAIEHDSWQKYDSFKMKEEILRLSHELDRARQQFQLEFSGLRNEINDLRSTLACIFDINEVGGRGSRRRVRELILEHGISSSDSENYDN